MIKTVDGVQQSETEQKIEDGWEVLAGMKQDRSRLDVIKIEGLEVFARHGVFPEEKKLGQRFVIHGRLYMNTRKAGKTDDLDQAVDYGAVCRMMYEWMQAHTCDLIEAVAERLAEEVLLCFPAVREIRLEICKPQAPVGLPFQSVSVEIHRKWETACLALGSNLGDREAYIRNAVEAMKEEPKIRVLQVSSLMETEPYGGVASEVFLNGAMEVETLLSPEELLEYLQGLEAAALRVREQRWGNRTLDLDILLYGEEILWTEDLKIPHPEMACRDFVLEPLAEIVPFRRHPVRGISIAALREEYWNHKGKNKGDHR